MTICPVAMAVGCKRCPIFSVCPAKGVIGDHKKEPEKLKADKAAATPRKKKR